MASNGHNPCEEIINLGKDIVELRTMIKEDIKGREEFRSEIRSAIKKHDAILFGNGHKGIITRTQELETATISHRDHVRILWGAFAAAIATIIANNIWSQMSGK